MLSVERRAAPNSILECAQGSNGCCPPVLSSLTWEDERLQADDAVGRVPPVEFASPGSMKGHFVPSNPNYSMIYHLWFMYLTSGSRIFNWIHLLIVFLQSHSTCSGLCYFKAFYAEKHVSKTILWPSVPPAYARNTKLSYPAKRNIPIQISHLEWPVLTLKFCPGIAKCYLAWVKSCQKPF